MEDQDQYGAQNEIYTEEGTPLIDQNTGQEGDGNEVSLTQDSGGGNEGSGDTGFGEVRGEDQEGTVVSGEPPEDSGVEGGDIGGEDQEGTVVSGEPPEDSGGDGEGGDGEGGDGEGGDGEGGDTGTGNQVIRGDGSIGVESPSGSGTDASTVQPTGNTEVAANGVTNIGSEPQTSLAVTANVTSSAGTNNQVVTGNSTAVNTQQASTTTQIIPSINTYNTYTDNPTRAQYVLLKDQNGIERWYKDLGVFGLEEQPGMPPPGATTSAPVQNQSGIAVTSPTVTIDANAMGPLQIPLRTQLKNPDASNYGQKVLAYDINGIPHWYLSTPGLFGWVETTDPVPAGTPTANIVTATVTTTNLPGITNCGPFSYTDTGIPGGLSYGSNPGQYTLRTGLTAQVSNYNQFGYITAEDPANYGNPPATFVRVNSVTAVDSYVNSEGVTVCRYILNYDQASRNTDDPPPPPPGEEGGKPLAGSIAITVEKNSINNLVTLPVTGGYTQINYISPTSAPGATFVSAGTANPLEYYYTPPANYSGGDSVTYSARGVHGTSNFGQISITVNTGPNYGVPSFNFTDVPGLSIVDTQIESPSATITGGFLGEWNLALFAEHKYLDPPGVPSSPPYYDNLYVVGMKRTRGAVTTTFLIPSTAPFTPNSLRVGVIDGDIITPIIRSPLGNSGAQTVVRFKVRCSPPGFPDGPGGGYNVVEDTFTVRVASNTIVPAAFNFESRYNLDPSIVYTAPDEVTVIGITPGAGIPVKLERFIDGTYGPAGNLLIDTGSGYVQTGYSSFVYLNNKIKYRVTTPSTFETTHTYRLTMGSGVGVNDNFDIVTRPPTVNLTNFNFIGKTGLEINDTSNTAQIQLSFEGGPGTLSVNNGATIVIAGVDTGLSSTLVNSGQNVAIRATSSSAYNTTRVFTATLVVGSINAQDTFEYITRAPILTPTWSGDFINVRDLQLSEIVTSNTLTVSAFDLPVSIVLTNAFIDPTTNVAVNNVDSTAVILKNSVNVGTSTTISAGDTIAIRGTADSDEYYKTTTYTLTYGSATKTWSATTKHNDHMMLFDPY